MKKKTKTKSKTNIYQFQCFCVCRFVERWSQKEFGRHFEAVHATNRFAAVASQILQVRRAHDNRQNGVGHNHKRQKVPGKRLRRQRIATPTEQVRQRINRKQSQRAKPAPRRTHKSYYFQRPFFSLPTQPVRVCARALLFMRQVHFRSASASNAARAASRVTRARTSRRGCRRRSGARSRRTKASRAASRARAPCQRRHPRLPFFCASLRCYECHCIAYAQNTHTHTTHNTQRTTQSDGWTQLEVRHAGVRPKQLVAVGHIATARNESRNT